MSEPEPVVSAAPERTEPDQLGSELSLLAEFLDYHRATLEWKCAGLSDAQLKLRAAPPSRVSLLGLVRHLTEVERGWFQRRFSGRDVPRLWGPPRADADWEDLDGAPAAEVFAAWRAEVARSREVVATAADPEVRSRQSDGPTFHLRWMLVHLIEEYARHNGHADLVREAIDGATGE